MRYIVVCPECGASNIKMDEDKIGFFTCEKCNNSFTVSCAFNDEISQNKKDQIES